MYDRKTNVNRTLWVRTAAENGNQTTRRREQWKGVKQLERLDNGCRGETRLESRSEMVWKQCQSFTTTKMWCCGADSQMKTGCTQPYHAIRWRATCLRLYVDLSKRGEWLVCFLQGSLPLPTPGQTKIGSCIIVGVRYRSSLSMQRAELSNATTAVRDRANRPWKELY